MKCYVIIYYLPVDKNFALAKTLDRANQVLMKIIVQEPRIRIIFLTHQLCYVLYPIKRRVHVFH